MADVLDDKKTCGATLVVSACLAGANCRYNAGNCADPAIVALVEEGKAIPVCPEELAGFATPRENCEIVVGDDGSKRVVDKTGVDHTAAYQKGAALTLDLCRALGVTEAVLKPNSPSCGVGRIYDGTFSGKTVSGNGITANLLIQNGIHVRSHGGEPSQG